MEDVIRGRVWKFGDDVSTDLILPGSIEFAVEAGRMTPAESIPHCMAANRPDWWREVRSGDLIVAGLNFGAGSSRPAHLPLQAMGIRAVIAESAARLFARTSLNAAFLVVACPGITRLAAEGDELLIELSRGVITKVGSDAQLRFPPLAGDSPPMEILRAGGLIPYLMKTLHQERPPGG
jgi:3-isopropylmalate/(R)-2-methylmalate dehydratase small subunit